MAAEQNITEAQNIREQFVMKEQKINEEEKISKEFNNITVNESDPPDEATMMSQDNAQAESSNDEPNSPMQENSVGDDLSDIWGPFDENEMMPKSLLDEPLSKYYYCEWSAVEHIFMPIIEMTEELNKPDWSPCVSPRNELGL